MSNQADHLSLKLPPHDLEVLSFSAPQPKKVKEWVEGLPQMNVGETAKRLYAAIQELNRLKTDADTRFQLMEIMRGPIRFMLDQLARPSFHTFVRTKLRANGMVAMPLLCEPV